MLWGYTNSRTGERVTTVRSYPINNLVIPSPKQDNYSLYCRNCGNTTRLILVDKVAYICNQFENRVNKKAFRELVEKCYTEAEEKAGNKMGIKLQWDEKK
jgi:hypothetical protein